MPLDDLLDIGGLFDGLFDFLGDLLYIGIDTKGARGCLVALVMLAVYIGLAVAIWWFFDFGFVVGPIVWLASCVGVTWGIRLINRGRRPSSV